MKFISFNGGEALVGSKHRLLAQLVPDFSVMIGLTDCNSERMACFRRFNASLLSDAPFKAVLILMDSSCWNLKSFWQLWRSQRTSLQSIKPLWMYPFQQMPGIYNALQLPTKPNERQSRLHVPTEQNI